MNESAPPFARVDAAPKRWVARLPPQATLPLGISVAAFLLDLGTPNNVADGFLYTLAVLACVWVPRADAALYAAAALMIPMGIGFAVSHSSLPLWEGLLDRVLGAAAIWLAAIVVWRNAKLIGDRERTLVQLRELHGSAERAAHTERLELSRWLHEGLAQEVAAVGWGIDRLAHQAADPVGVRTEARELRLLVDRVLDTVRGKAGALRDADVAPGTQLTVLVERYVAGYGGRTGLSVAVAGLKSVGVIPQTHTTLCFKVVQEALTNVAKHACASRVRVDFREAARVIHLTVTDDGCGLSADARLKPDSLGLLGLTERLTAIGGALSVLNVAPHGVRLTARIPLG